MNDPDIRAPRCICRDLTCLKEQDRKDLDSLPPVEVFLSLMSSVFFTDRLHPPSPPSLRSSPS